MHPLVFAVAIFGRVKRLLQDTGGQRRELRVLSAPQSALSPQLCWASADPN